MWNPGAIVFVILAITVATGPVLFATFHSIKFGHRTWLLERNLWRDPQRFGWQACTECKALVLDPVEHAAAVHAA